MVPIVSMFSSAMSHVHIVIPSWISDLPLIEGAILLVLAIITLYRKRLSANAKYRSNYTSSKTKIMKNEVSVSMKYQHFSSNNSPTIMDCIPDFTTTSFAHAVTSVYKYSKAKLKPNSIIIGSTHQNRTGMSVSTLTHDNLWHIIELLTTDEVYHLSATCRSLRYDLYTHIDWIWEQLWISRYCMMWQHPAIRAIREKRSIYWDPMKNYGHPQQGWRDFYREFESCWKDWLLCGACSSDYCIIALYGSILDVTSFLPLHPGSLESLSDYAGGDATEQFLDIGHSSHAYHLSLNYTIYNSSYEATIEDKTIEFERKLSHNHHIMINNTLSSSKLHHHTKKVTKFHKHMKQCGERLAQHMMVSSQNDPSYMMLKMMPSITGYHDCIAHAEHIGRSRVCWDPLERRWYVWWTCCGCGGPVDGYNDFLL